MTINHRTLLSKKTVAERWDCSVRTIERYIESGKLGAVDAGFGLRIPIDSVREFEKRMCLNGK